MNTVYWIRRKGENDLSQGYIGITSQKVRDRYMAHRRVPSNVHLANAFKKYDDIEVVTIVEGLSREDAITVEKQLRPTDYIGWNQNAGGNDPPKATKRAKGYNFGNQARKGIKDSSETRARKAKNNGRYKRPAVSCVKCRKEMTYPQGLTWHLPACKDK